MRAGPPDKIEILGLLSRELGESLVRAGFEPYRGRQILQWIYKKGVTSFEEMSNLSQKLRLHLAEHYSLNGITEVRAVEGQSGTKKFVLRLYDGLVIETVLMKDSKGNGWTICLSSQVGCPIGCDFCMTGKAGFYRNLSAAEIMGQIPPMIRSLPVGGRISNVVFMGMGEPLLNVDNVITAIRIILSEEGLQISPKKITVSTVGIPQGLEKLGKAVPVSLALSLTAVRDDLRSRLIPLNKKYPLNVVLKAVRRYPLAKMLTVEYVLLKDVNDSRDDALRLVALLRGMWCKINLIPYNSIPGGSYHPPPDTRIRAFQDILLKAKFTAIVRKSKGGDVLAACGQLGTALLKEKS